MKQTGPASKSASAKRTGMPARFQKRLVRISIALAGMAITACAVYFAMAYELIPLAWHITERRHPALNAVGTRAFTSAGIPGDPLNVAFIGSEASLHQLMLSSGWYPADAITLKSALRIAKDSLLHKPYPDAPVSDLFVNGLRQNYAFEQAQGGNPSKRHHVRFWLAPGRDTMDRPLWIGAATFDSGVGLSHFTGQITHHIAAEVDAERDKLLADLTQHDNLVFQWISAFQPELQGRNGGGDRFVTDGRLVVFQERLGAMVEIPHEK